jgi:Rieske Fe-S protein
MLAAGRARAGGEFHRFERVMLTDGRDQPLDAGALEARTEYIFQYPFVSTPCFLINLDKPLPGGEELTTEQGASYRWNGGIGPNRSIVAFSAICAHRLSHPTRSASFIGYRPGDTGFLNADLKVARQADVIQCCSEQSVYDPTRGARVLGGPAPQPLAAIELEYGNDGRLYATGVYGGMLFQRYFEKFSHRLVLEYERFDVDTPVSSTTRVIRGDEFTRYVVNCG